MSQPESNTQAKSRPRWLFTLRDLILLTIVLGLVFACAAGHLRSWQKLPRSEVADSLLVDEEFAKVLQDFDIDYRNGRASLGNGDGSLRRNGQEGRSSYTLLNDDCEPEITQALRQRIVSLLKTASCQIDYVNSPGAAEDIDVVIAYSSDEIQGFVSASIILHPSIEERMHHPDGAWSIFEYPVTLLYRHYEMPK